MFGMILEVVKFTSINYFARSVSSIFTDQEVVISHVLHSLFISTVCNFMDAIVTILIGIFKGIGKQIWTTFAYVICFYIIGVPNTYMFCFTFKFGLRGLWSGLLVGLIVIAIVLLILLIKADWHMIAAKAKESLLKESLQMTTNLLSCYETHDFSH